MQHYSCSIVSDGHAISANPSWLDHMSHTGPCRFNYSSEPPEKQKTKNRLWTIWLFLLPTPWSVWHPGVGNHGSWTRLVSTLRLEFVKYPTSTIIAFKELVSWAVIRYAVFKGTSESNNSALYGHVLQSNSSLQYRFYVPHHVPSLISFYR